MLTCKEGEARNAVITSITPNCILLPYDTRQVGALILRESKTQDRANPKLYNWRLGLGLLDEIRASLQQLPRDYLFTEARSIKPCTHGGFQQYASRTLKTLFGKPCLNAYAVEAFIHLTRACLWQAQHQGQGEACPRHVSFSRDTSPVSIHSQI